MKLARVSVAALTCAAAALWSAGPASAVALVEGVYTYIQDGTPMATWKITPLCVPVVGDGREPLELPLGCQLQVSSTLDNTGGFRLAGDRWTYSDTTRGGIKCADGSKAPSTEQYVFDESLTGTYTQGHGSVCGLAPGLTHHPFTLAFVSPLPNPYDRYPLNCQPDGLQLCG